MAVEYFYQYLYGRKFKVYTDHLPLTWLLNKKDPHPRLGRWVLRLAYYNLEINYKPGSENVIEDMLSRLPEENEENEDANEDIDCLVATLE